MIDNNINDLDPVFKVKVQQFLDNAKKQGYNIRIFEGRRSLDRQKELYAIGRTTQLDKKPVTWTINSQHLIGKAVDIVFVDAHGNPSWSGDYQALRKIASKYGIGNLGQLELDHFQIL